MPGLNDILTIILAGGRGSRLYPLNKLRSKPAVPIAGKYRLIDIPISNCINSGLFRIDVLTQFNSHSLHRHITQTYNFDTFHTGFVEILAAEQNSKIHRLVPGQRRCCPQAIVPVALRSFQIRARVKRGSSLPHGLWPDG